MERARVCMHKGEDNSQRRWREHGHTDVEMPVKIITWWAMITHGGRSPEVKNVSAETRGSTRASIHTEAGRRRCGVCVVGDPTAKSRGALGIGLGTTRSGPDSYNRRCEACRSHPMNGVGTLGKEG